MSQKPGWGWTARLGAMAFSGIFMLSFGAGGIFGGVWPLWQTFSTALAARGFESVPGQVTSAELVAHRGSKGSTTWEVQARYAYRWQGRDFEGTRIGVAGTGADNIGSWHDVWHQRLKQAHEAEQPIPVWVDPQRPERSLLDRSVRWGLVALHLVFGVIFTAVGVGAAVFFFGALFNRLPDKSVKKGKAINDDAPPTMDRVMRGRLAAGSEVLFPRRWPRVVGVLMLLVLGLWLVSGPSVRGIGVMLAALPATAWTALALHLLSLRWTWRREGDRLQVRRASWLHERRYDLTRAELGSLRDKLVYTSSVNDGPTVRHHALLASQKTGGTVALTPALPGPAALQAVRKQLRQGMDLAL